MDKQYIGDGAYVEHNVHIQGDVLLTTSNGVSDTNSIYLEPEVLAELLQYMAKRFSFVISKPFQNSSMDNINLWKWLTTTIDLK